MNRAVAGRLLTHAACARSYLITAGLCGLAVTGLILAQAGLLAHALAGAAPRDAMPALRGTLLVLLAVVVAQGSRGARGRGDRAPAAPPRSRSGCGRGSPGMCWRWDPRGWAGSGQARSRRSARPGSTGSTRTSPGTCPRSCSPSRCRLPSWRPSPRPTGCPA